METEIKLSELDKLFRLIAEYRESENYRELLRYISSFKNLSPYNAFLVVQQRPGCKYVLSPDEWKREGRDIRLHARPLVILRPFGPVQFVYDISDTVISGERERNLFDNIEDVVERLSAPYRTYGADPSAELGRLVWNAELFGVQTRSFVTGSVLAAQISYIDDTTRRTDNYLSLLVGGKRVIKWPANYLLEIRENAGNGEAFASCCHELGHLFCGHLKKPKCMETQAYRYISHSAKEFEAESVAWLVCQHFEVDNPSEEYLAGYCGENKLIPDGVSIERIFFASNLVIKMSSQKMDVKDGWLYKYDEEFKKRIKKGN
ncbi:MAG: hypothetical protein HDS42_06235 [Bacteroides sp.]|nr:hypothetical protein [Bacteroides sp.]